MKGIESSSRKRESYLNENVGENVGENVSIPSLSELNITSAERSILLLIFEHPDISARLLAERLDKSSRTIERYIKHLKEMGLLTRVGGDRGGKWIVNETLFDDV